MLDLRSHIGRSGALPKRLEPHLQLPFGGSWVVDVLPFGKENQSKKLFAELLASDKVDVNDDTILDRKTLGDESLLVGPMVDPDCAEYGGLTGEMFVVPDGTPDRFGIARGKQPIQGLVESAWPGCDSWDGGSSNNRPK
jgi:hypothetical protein